MITLAALFTALLASLGSALVAVLSYFSAYAFKRFMLIAAAVAALGVAVSAFVSVAQDSIQGLVVAMPSEVQTAFLFLPDNIGTCVSAIVTVHVARWVYSLYVMVINMKAA